jgi:cytochrome oxidase Cu insertion factor (SCO1/SenC/PrrC family)
LAKDGNPPQINKKPDGITKPGLFHEFIGLREHKIALNLSCFIIDTTKEGKNRMNLRLIRLGILGTAIGMGAIALAAYYMQSKEKTYMKDTPTNLPDLGGSFRLVDQFGKTRTSQEFRGKYMLVYFGYTYCPDVCPMGLQNITAALNGLGRDISRIVPIFITIDPERDDVKNLSLYAPNWHSSFVFLTGTDQQLAPVLKSFKVYTSKVKPEGTEADYLMDHSALIYLMDRQGKFVDFFPHTTSPAVIANKIRKHLMDEMK